MAQSQSQPLDFPTVFLLHPLRCLKGEGIFFAFGGVDVERREDRGRWGFFIPLGFDTNSLRFFANLKLVADPVDLDVLSFG